MRREGRAALEHERSKFDSLRTEKEREHKAMGLAQMELLRLRQEDQLRSPPRGRRPQWCKAEICAVEEASGAALPVNTSPVPRAGGCGQQQQR